MTRCVVCGSLNRWHAPHCPNREPLARITRAVDDLERQLDRVLALVTGDSTTNPQPQPDRSTT